MKRDDLEELHYITSIDNLRSICHLGILSHRGARPVNHRSVAKKEIQDRRAKKGVPGDRLLHDYVNLYICARNKMLRSLRHLHEDLCVLRVSPAVLDIPGTVVSDRNASSDYARFEPAPTGLRIVNRDMVFAEYWTHPGDPIEEMRHGSIKCAEVLVPDRVPPEFLVGAYVSCEDSLPRFKALGLSLGGTVDSHLFFL